MKALWIKHSEYTYRLYDADRQHEHVGSIYRQTPLYEAAHWNAYVREGAGLRNVGVYSDGFEARLVVEAAIREPKQPEPRVNEASLFVALKELAKTICDFAYENRTDQAVFFDVVAKDGGLFRVSVNLLRHDAYSDRKPIVVLEPKPKLGSYPCPECGYINNRPGTCSNAGEHTKPETVVYGTRPDGSYRSPGNWTDELEAEYQAFIALMQQRNPALTKQPNWFRWPFTPTRSRAAKTTRAAATTSSLTAG
jgi:hypothetical protein